MYDIFNIDSEEFAVYRFNITTPHGYNSTKDYFSQKLNIHLPSIYQYKTDKIVSIPAGEYYSAKKQSIKNGPPPSILPIAVRYVGKSGKYLIERPPFQVEVDFRMGTATSGAPKMHPIKIWIPWTLTLLDTSTISTETLNKTQMFFNDSSLYTVDDTFVTMYLPNAYSNGTICFANSMNDLFSVMDSNEITSNVSYLYNFVFNNYMSGGWNCDLTPTINYYLSSAMNINLSSYKYFSEYINPSTERKKRALDNFRECDSSMYKAAKNAIFSRVHPGSIRKHHRLYLRHFAILSTFTLEETLGFVTDLKNFSKKTSQYSSSIARLFDEPKNQYQYNAATNTSVSVINSILSNPLINKTYSYSPSCHGMIVMNNPPLIHHSFNKTYRVDHRVSAIPVHLFPAIKDILIANMGAKEPVNIGIDYRTDDPTKSTLFIIDDVKEHLSSAYSSLLSNVTPESLDSNMRVYLNSEKVYPYIQKVL